MKTDKVKIICLFALFFLPILAAHLVYQHRGSLAISTKNLGAFVQDKQHTFGEHQKWRIMQVRAVPCDEHCTYKYNLLQNLPVSLGTKKDLVEVSTTNISYPHNSIVIVEPHGNIVLYYQPEQDIMDVVKDTKILLRATNARS